MSSSEAPSTVAEPEFSFGRMVYGFCPARKYVWPARCACCNGPADGTKDEHVELDLGPLASAFGTAGAIRVISCWPRTPPTCPSAK
jgi:hypothetical protein